MNNFTFVHLTIQVIWVNFLKNNSTKQTQYETKSEYYICLFIISKLITNLKYDRAAKTNLSVIE